MFFVIFFFSLSLVKVWANKQWKIKIASISYLLKANSQSQLAYKETDLASFDGLELAQFPNFTKVFLMFQQGPERM